MQPYLEAGSLQVADVSKMGPYWIGMSPSSSMTAVLGQRAEETRSRSGTRPREAMGWREAPTSQTTGRTACRPPEAGRGRKDSPTGVEVELCPHLNFGLPCSRTVRPEISVAFSHPVWASRGRCCRLLWATTCPLGQKGVSPPTEATADICNPKCLLTHPIYVSPQPLL